MSSVERGATDNAHVRNRELLYSPITLAVSAAARFIVQGSGSGEGQIAAHFP
jgi:hypothetical protein